MGQLPPDVHQRPGQRLVGTGGFGHPLKAGTLSWDPLNPGPSLWSPPNLGIPPKGGPGSLWGGPGFRGTPITGTPPSQDHLSPRKRTPRTSGALRILGTHPPSLNSPPGGTTMLETPLPRSPTHPPQRYPGGSPGILGGPRIFGGSSEGFWVPFPPQDSPFFQGFTLKLASSSL